MEGEHNLLVRFLGMSSHSHCGKNGNGVSLAKWPDFDIFLLHSLSYNLWSLSPACQGEWDHRVGLSLVGSKELRPGVSASGPSHPLPVSAGSPISGLAPQGDDNLEPSLELGKPSEGR